MLLIAADRDFSPLGQAEQLFSALFRQGKDAELVTYWGEGHVVASPANLADLYRRVIAFLRDNLQPGPAVDD
jgi:dipeptidyl aminopeptidase/acylaminoacyl peptidase